MLKTKTQLASLSNVLHCNPTYAPYSLTSLKMFLNEISAVNLMSFFQVLDHVRKEHPAEHVYSFYYLQSLH